MDLYCGSPFWDANLTWYTDDPDFTSCFQNTIFTWIPCGFLWLTGLFEVFHAASRVPSPTRWTKLGLMKLLNTLIIIGLKLVHLWIILDPGSRDSLPQVEWLTPITFLLTLTLSLIIVILHKRHQIHTSGVHFVFWVLMTIHALITLRTAVKGFRGDDVDLIVLILHSAHAICTLLQLFLNCWADLPKASRISQYAILREEQDGEKSNPVLSVSCLSFILFSWVTPFARLGYKKPIDLLDLWPIRPWDKCGILLPKFLKYCSPNTKRKKGVFANIVKPMWHTSWKSFMVAILSIFTVIIILFIFPLLQGLMIGFVEDNKEETWKGYLYAVLFLATALTLAIVRGQFYYHMNTVYMNIQSCLCALIYRKSLAVTVASRKGSSSGQIVNLMSVDVEKIRVLIYGSDMIVSAPLQITVALYFLWQQLGPAILAGLFFMLFLIPINWLASRKVEQYQSAQMAKKDERVKLTNELLSGMRIVKLYAWELAFENQMHTIRAEEIGFLRKKSYFKAFINFMFDIAPFLVADATFITYVLLDPSHTLDASKAFVSLTLFSLLNEPLVALPRFITSCVEGWVSAKRVSQFLNMEEVDPAAVIHEDTDDNKEKDRMVTICGGNFNWELESALTLKDLEFSVEKGNLTAVVGVVGSGKSSILAAILGEMNRVSGRVVLKGSVAYVPQIAWIQNATLKENITFGKVLDQARYDDVVERCGLLPDFEMLPAGDETEIGEKGINLSGGQKQRISLARAAYSDADIYLLDDPLSAVDSHVAKHIFDRLVGPTGLLANKTRILVTHAYNFLSQVDDIVVLRGGEITEHGSYQTLLSNEKSFANLLKEHSQTEEAETEVLDKNENKETAKKNPSDKEKSTGKGQLIQVESVETGTVKASVVVAYIKAFGVKFFVLVLILLGLSQTFSVSANGVLSAWTSEPIVNGTQDRSLTDMYLGIYTGLGLLMCLSNLFGYLTMYLLSLLAAKRLHNDLFGRIIRAPMSFFDTTPLGRILNRFSSDVDVMDTTLAYDMCDCLISLFKMLAILTVVTYSTPVFLVFIIPLSLVYFFLQRFYIATMRQLQRLLAVLKSPIYALFGETLNGTSTIRAYKAQSRYIGLIEGKIDTFESCCFPHQVVRRWLSVRLESIGSSIIFLVAVCAVVWRHTINSSLVGLALTYVVQISDLLSWLVKIVSYAETDAVSIERILEYSGVETEAALEKPEQSPEPSWPQSGQIIFNDYGTRYRPDLDLVLRGITCYINPGEKIGIVGRTGAGKSSLTLAVFRLIEAAFGRIVIDGLDIANMGLHDVRKRITVIPQDPVLFSTSLRMNLDPFSEYTDNQLWDSLQHSHLKAFVETQAEGLRMAISEGGENLSVGQRQLVCLARAILRKSRILVLDEATASVDHKTDELIQSTIRTEFRGCTILNVAHRLKTVLDSTRILVLDRGSIAEFDTPSNLLQNRNSIFYGMARNAGIVQLETLLEESESSELD